MTPSQMTTAGIAFSVFDKIPVAVKDLLLNDEEVKAWTNSNVIRGEVLALPEGFAGNRIYVGALPPTFDGGLGNCAPATAKVMLGFAWEEFGIALEDEAPSIYSVLAHCIRTIFVAPTLAVPRFGKRNLVKKLKSVTLARQPDFVERPASVVIVAAFVLEFELNLNASTMDAA